ncbi:MAG: SRPBCC family protein [Merismopedia sp. SIO2A8]|nr:SRPBCC family protein [Merismopedia sp. SIO2A8]
MKRLRTILIGLLGFATVLLGIGFALPSTAHVERSITISAEPAAVFALISDFEAWGQWSPWAELDPDAQLTIDGSGLGQTMAWSSDNPQVGQGQQEIVELERDRHLKTHLEFEGQGIADATFDLNPTLNETEEGVLSNGTEVIWSLDSNLSKDIPLVFKPINNYLGLLLDGLIGQDYERGLANLKRIAEG